VGVIPAAIGTLSSNYPRRDKKDPDKYQYVDQVMAGLQGTPCCVQMSQALNESGVRIPGQSYRRNPNPYLKKKDFYYILAVDELEEFLTSLYGEGETINKDVDKTRSMAEITAYIAQRPGLLLFRYSTLRVPPPKGQFEHTELWDGSKILQRDMDEGFLFRRPRVLMWDTNDPARWLVDYMQTQP
jgi:Type VI secretion system (T6SS), amidase effector protein 4